jgi:FkbM family methyltransferase
MHILRKAIRIFGLDLHRYRPEADQWQMWRNEGIKTVLDIGANTGQFAVQARGALPEAYIYSFEPLKECFDKIKTTFKNDDKFEAFNFALGDKKEEVVMNKSAYSPSSSLLPMAESHKKLFPHTKEHTPESIEVRKLDDAAQGMDLESEILIKVDVQGFEDKVITGGMETFKRAKGIIIENSFIELYEGQPLFDDIYTKLKSLGFSYLGSAEQKIDKQTGRVVSEDSIFFKQTI